jgi:hypothetical protein
LWHELVFKLAIITLPVVVLSQIVGVDAMVLLFTEQYRFSGALYQVYVLVLLRCVTAFPVLPRAYARTGLILQSTVISFIIMLVAGWVCTLYFGMFGTVAAFLLSQYVHAYIQLQCGRREIGLRWSLFLPWKRLFQITGIAAISAILPTIAMFVVHTTIGRLLICSSLYLVSYILLLAITGVFDWVHDPAIRKVLDRYLPFKKA